MPYRSVQNKYGRVSNGREGEVKIFRESQPPVHRRRISGCSIITIVLLKRDRPEIQQGEQGIWVSVTKLVSEAAEVIGLPLRNCMLFPETAI